MLSPVFITEMTGGPCLPNWIRGLELPLGLPKCDWWWHRGMQRGAESTVLLLQSEYHPPTSMGG